MQVWQVWDQGANGPNVSVSSSPHLSCCVCILLPDSLMLRIQSHADLKPARSALFWPQIEACPQT